MDAASSTSAAIACATRNTLAQQVSWQGAAASFVVYFLLFDGLGAKLTKKTQKALQLLAQLKQQVHTKKAKNVDILSLSQEVSLACVHTHTLCCVSYTPLC